MGHILEWKTVKTEVPTFSVSTSLTLRVHRFCVDCQMTVSTLVWGSGLAQRLLPSLCTNEVPGSIPGPALYVHLVFSPYSLS